MLQKINHSYHTQTEKTLRMLGWTKIGMGGVLFSHPDFKTQSFSQEHAVSTSCSMYGVDPLLDEQTINDKLCEAFINRITPEIKYFNALRDIEIELCNDTINVESIRNIITRALEGDVK